MHYITSYNTHTHIYWLIVSNGGEKSIFGPSQIILRVETAVAWRLAAKQIEIKSSFRRTFFMESQSWTNQATHKPTIKLHGSLQGLIKFQISDGRSKQPIPFFSFVTFLLDSLFHPFGDRTVTHNPRLIYEHRSITKIPSCQSQWVVWVCSLPATSRQRRIVRAGCGEGEQGTLLWTGYK